MGTFADGEVFYKVAGRQTSGLIVQVWRIRSSYGCQLEDRRAARQEVYYILY